MVSEAHLFLALAGITLLLVIVVQDWLYIPLRNQTISAGLTGPYHVVLDIAYVPLSAAIVLNFHGLQEVLAVTAAASLILVAVTNTAWRWVDSFTDDKHALWHSRFTLIVFTSVLALELVSDRGWLWGLTAANVAIPVAAYAWFHFRPTTIKGVTIAASPAAEKLLVLGFVSWLIVQHGVGKP